MEFCGAGFDRSDAYGRKKEIVWYLNKSRSRQRSAKDGYSFGDRLDQSIRTGDSPRKARERTDNLQLIRSFMQRSAGLAQHRRCDVGADEKNGNVVLQTFQQRNQRKQVSGAGGSKDCGYLAAAAIEAVRGITCGLFMANDPMVKFRRLAQRFIDRNVVNAGNAKASGDAMPHQSSDNSLRAGHLAQMGRGWGSNRHWR